MEAEMKQLERDIETIEKHRVIYIANPFFKWKPKRQFYVNLIPFFGFV